MSESMIGVPNNHVDENGIRWRRTRCHMCHMNCGIFAGVDTATGRLVEAKGPTRRRGRGAVQPSGRAWPACHQVPLPSQAHQPPAQARGRTRRGQVGADILRPGHQGDFREATRAHRQVRPRDARVVRGHVPFRPPVGAQPLHEPAGQPRQRGGPRHHLLVLELLPEHGDGGLAGRVYDAGLAPAVEHDRQLGQAAAPSDTPPRRRCGASSRAARR